MSEMDINSDVARASAPVAFITGGASGMGLAVAQDLAAKGWNITIVDLSEKSISSVEHNFDTERTIFVKADVTDYESQGKAFLQTWDKWNRLDLVFANAGIGDKMNFYAPATESHPGLPGIPAKPNELVIDICLNAMVYSAYLGLHFFRKNPSKAGKIVFTSSMCGLYPGNAIPLYTAAKHGIVGLTRAMANRLKTLGEPITVNCICPGLVDTGLTASLIAVAPPEYLTPKSTIVRAVIGFVEDDSRTGQAAECSVDQIHYRQQPEWGDDAAQFVMTDQLEAEMKRRGDALKVKTCPGPGVKRSFYLAPTPLKKDAKIRFTKSHLLCLYLYFHDLFYSCNPENSELVLRQGSSMTFFSAHDLRCILQVRLDN